MKIFEIFKARYYITYLFVSFVQSCAKSAPFKQDKMQKHGPGRKSGRVSQQWEIILDTVAGDPSIFTGYKNTARGRDRHMRIWRDLSRRLNSQSTGATKSPQEWAIVSTYLKLCLGTELVNFMFLLFIFSFSIVKLTCLFIVSFSGLIITKMKVAVIRTATRGTWGCRYR